MLVSFCEEIAALSLGQRVEESANGDAERMRGHWETACLGSVLDGRCLTGLAVGLVHLFRQPVTDGGAGTDAELGPQGPRALIALRMASISASGSEGGPTISDHAVTTVSS